MALSAIAIAEISRIFGLTPLPNELPIDCLAILDGTVTTKDTVWWRSREGPVHVSAALDWGNIKKYPQLYSIAKPKVASITYED